MNPFRNILRLSIGDLLAKALNFIAFVYLARMLGVQAYGVLEFAIAAQLYLLLAGDGGLELWATREAARGADLHDLIARVIPLRLLLALVAFAAIAAIVALAPSSPQFPGIRALLLLFGLSVFPQAVGVKWAFMGREDMARVARGLVLAQIAFGLTVLLLVRRPEHVFLVPVLRLLGDGAMTAFFWVLFVKTHGRPLFRFSLRGCGAALRPAAALGAGSALGLLSFNFDSLMLGVIKGASAVGWYGAAYKPATVVLAMPLTYFIGLFPALSRTHRHDAAEFRNIVVNSLRLAALFAVPVAVGGTFLARPIIDLLFGPDYAPSVAAFRLLAWAAALVILRGTFRQALNASEHQHLDLRCAAIATSVNVVLNLLLIPGYGIVGAAAATIVSEVIWLAATAWLFHRHVLPVNLVPMMLAPAAAAVLMAVGFVLTQPLLWGTQAIVAAVVYISVLVGLGQATPLANALARRG